LELFCAFRADAKVARRRREDHAALGRQRGRAAVAARARAVALDAQVGVLALERRAALVRERGAARLEVVVLADGLVRAGVDGDDDGDDGHDERAHEEEGPGDDAHDVALRLLPAVQLELGLVLPLRRLELRVVALLRELLLLVGVLLDELDELLVVDGPVAVLVELRELLADLDREVPVLGLGAPDDTRDAVPGRCPRCGSRTTRRLAPPPGRSRGPRRRRAASAASAASRRGRR